MATSVFSGVYRVVVDVTDEEDDDGNPVPEPTLEKLQDYLLKAASVDWDCEEYGNEAGVSAMVLEHHTLREDPDSLLDMLDNVTAALETCLAWYGKDMTPADLASRTRHAKQAREYLDAIQGQ